VLVQGLGLHRETVPVADTRVRRLIAISMCLLIGLSFLLLPSSQRIRAYNDDALFYGIIAANLANGHSWSFDGGLSKTTGFHWAGMATPAILGKAYGFVRGGFSYQEFFTVLYRLDIILLVLMTSIICGLGRRRDGSLILAGIGPWCISQSLVKGFGMEVVFLPLLLLVCVREATRDEVKTIWLFLAGFALVLTRIDYAPIPVIVGIISLLETRKGHHRVVRSQILIPCFAGPLVGGLLVCGLNFLVSGEFLSSSILAKGTARSLSWPDLWDNLGTQAVFLLIYGMTLVALRSRQVGASAESRVAGMTGFCILVYVILMRSLGGGNLGNWYDVAWGTLLVRSLLEFSERHILRISRGGWIAGAIGLAVLAVVVPRDSLRLRFGIERESRVPYWEALGNLGKKIAASTRVEDRIGVDDLPGRLTFFSNRNFVSLDGVANGPAYVTDFLRKQQVGRYIRDNLDYVLLLLNSTELEEIERHAREEDPDQGFVAHVGFPFNKNLKLSEYEFSKEQIIFRQRLQGLNAEAWLVRVDSGRKPERSEPDEAPGV